MVNLKRNFGIDCYSKNKRKESFSDRAKSHVKTGVMSMAGMGAIGGIAGTTGFPAAGPPMVGTIGSGLGLVNVGETAKTGMSFTKMFGESTSYRKRRRR